MNFDALHSKSLISAEQWSQEARELEAESLGWLSLGKGAYLHVHSTPEEETPEVVHVVGMAEAALTLGGGVLLLR